MTDVQETMKRKYENDQAVSPSKKRRTTSMPLTDKLTLYNLHGLQAVNGPYCIRLDLGLAVVENECETCQDDEYTEKNENDIDKIIEKIAPHTKKKCDLYKIDALIRDIWQNSGAGKVDCKQNESCVSVVLENVSHLSWFSIQLMLHNSPVEWFEAARRKVTMNFSAKEECESKKKENESDILRDMLVACHRNVYHMLFCQKMNEDVYIPKMK